MSLLETLKSLFGFAPHQTGTLPTPERALSTPAPGLPPAAERRGQILRFLVDKLRPYQNEPESAPAVLRLSIVCDTPEEEDVYRVALWDSQPGKFRVELDRQLVDNYIRLPKNGVFEYLLSPEPASVFAYREGNLSLIIPDTSTDTTPPCLARLTTLTGQTEHTDYLLDPAQKTSFCIGRGHTTQTTSGRVRTNDIVFLNDDDPDFEAGRGAGNGAVSRAHATIRYDAGQRRYTLLVDAGGLPGSGNKTKILHPDDSIERADIPGMGYPLQTGDQIELGGAVTLLFES